MPPSDIRKSSFNKLSASARDEFYLAENEKIIIRLIKDKNEYHFYLYEKVVNTLEIEKFEQRRQGWNSFEVSNRNRSFFIEVQLDTMGNETGDIKIIKKQTSRKDYCSYYVRKEI